ncbi:hypothetical protein RHS04_04874 [Rhizoctonia solani]|uniref:Zn(2)-C6 fungal-type domain-containing protein n=1 Tax=Rhizoctonia solani TaxID=456999 RepID=A0A8H7H730_9AGAM|nr:hypothetical protein RHS04_09073 [Rhizoctonia solani]KAF8679427.1 hypothetical protein RHS04_04874 [Rhizoctonia solani]
MFHSDCLTCKARNKKCDRTQGPSGCRRCVQAGIECEGYTIGRTQKSRHGIRNVDTSTKNKPDSVRYQYCPFPPDPSTQADGQININQLSGDKVFPGVGIGVGAASGAGVGSAVPVNQDRERGFCYPWRSDYLELVRHTDRQSPGSGSPLNSVISSQQTAVNAGGSGIRVEYDDPVSPALARLLEGGFDLRLQESVPSPPLELDRSHMIQRWDAYSQTVSSGRDRVLVDHDERLDSSEDTENDLRSVTKELVLDRRVESNTLPFVIHSFEAWANQFFFEPAQILPRVRDKFHLWIKCGSLRAALMSSVGLDISRSTKYDLRDFRIWEAKILDNTLQARARRVTGQEAFQALEHTHKYITTLRIVGSLANVLSMIDLLAPIFRQACPESSCELVNLPRALINDVNIQYYVTMDVLQSVITSRPMHFRYDLDFLSSRDEDTLNSDDGPRFKLRWLYGIPDRLVVTFARMNTLLEDYGNCVDPEKVREVENEIAGCKLPACSQTRFGSNESFGRVMAHEVWKLAAYVYLYMGLCGADSYNARVVKVQQEFMGVLKRVVPSRNPDSFMYVPMFILGMATNMPDQAALLTRLTGVTECSRAGTMGHDIRAMMVDIWTHTTGRAIRWYDLRPACLRVVRM